ncbi:MULTISPECIES: TRAP transporter small permease [unclassified Halomonas]|uniref:TRAP transporter small permease n=1 Tax=unclassified Halomonas TaxID=2609666 RepID=UPI002076A7C4|nr:MULTISPECIES: TRAP transporter small permease [unclassified Halomonas]
MDRVNRLVSLLLLYIAGAALLMMVFIVVGNIVMRQISASFGGTTEVVGWLTAIVVALSLAYSQRVKAHVELDLLVAHFPLRIQAILTVVVALTSFLFFTVVAWKLWEYGVNAMQRGSLSQTLRVAIYPFVYLVALGFSAFCLVLFADFISSFKKVITQ